MRCLDRKQNRILETRVGGKALRGFFFQPITGMIAFDIELCKG